MLGVYNILTSLNANILLNGDIYAAHLEFVNLFKHHYDK